MKFHRIAALLCLLAGMVLAQSPASASRAGQKFGVINLHAAILATQEGKQQVAVIRARFDPQQQKLRDGSRKLEELSDRLKNGASLTAQQKSQLQQEFDRTRSLLEQQAQDLQRQFNQVRDTMESHLLQRMLPIIENYARTHGYSVVINASAPWPANPVIYVDHGANLGAIAVRLYDARYPVHSSPAGNPKK